tara:strand:+ start:599 stop:1765 length:1167 start_codon:yes stop_codon:yes gene_type:complete
MDWPLVRLDELYEIARGGSPRPIKKFLTEDADGVNWIKIGDATASGKYIYETKEKIIPEGIKRSRFVNKGDFLLSNSMSFGRPYIMGTTGCIHDGWLVLSPKDKQVDQDFLYYLLGSPFVYQQFDSLAAGSTVRNLNIDLVCSVKIPLLPLEEQKRLVAVLDQAFAEIDKARSLTEKNLKNTRELFERYLQQIFSQRGEGWVDSTLADIAENLDSKRIPITKKDRVEGQHPYYGASGIVDYVNDYIFDEELLLVSEDGANLLARTYPIAFTATGKYWVNNHAHVLRFKDSFIQKFMEYYLNSISLEPYVSGMAQPKLNQKALNSISVPSVDSVTAKEIVGSISALEDELNQIQRIYKAKLDRLDELKKSLLQKAFSGELTKRCNEVAA